MATPYQKIARAALINWNGLSEEEANNKINNESIEELDSQVYAMDSVRFAVMGVSSMLGLTEEETTKLFNAVVYGPEDDEIFSLVSSKAKGFSEEQKLGVLSVIHDGWVINNSSEKTFNKKVGREQLRQYAPLPLIGWNEVRSDLLFLSPILSSINVTVSESELSESYYQMVAKYIEENNINGLEALTELISKGKLYYAVLPDELETRLLPLSEVVSSQIIQNWIGKDPKSYEIMKYYQENLSSDVTL